MTTDPSRTVLRCPLMSAKDHEQALPPDSRKSLAERLPRLARSVTRRLPLPVSPVVSDYPSG